MWKRPAVAVHDRAIELWARSGFIQVPVTFIDTTRFYDEADVAWFNQFHLTRDSAYALGEWLAGARRLSGTVVWVGDSWGENTGRAYAKATGVQLVQRSKPGRRLIDMLPTIARAPAADHLVLQFGVNDMSRGRDPLPDLHRAARLAKSPLVVVGVPPVAGFEDQAQALNARLAQTAAGAHGTKS